MVPAANDCMRLSIISCLIAIVYSSEVSQRCGGMAGAEGSMGISLGSHYSIIMEEFLQSLCHVMHHG